MNADQIKGKWRQFKGELKQQYGKFIDDAMQQIEGIDDMVFGKVQERYGDGKDEFMKREQQCRNQSTADATKQKTR
ncbi:CsbD family protein [Candidatus Nitrospira neomarina]|uniref:CsbD family protein n=1 Tax=Candidatus Nitrospira neomarina TaxID=3020899 RepID=A0AA96GSV8_9BACT|nr:CsbD family protein [Candidatus Nitrospira neomarina]WNM62951.1 CsbD family protein [Candidatus Nitrospira neomarina]